MLLQKFMNTMQILGERVFRLSKQSNRRFQISDLDEQTLKQVTWCLLKKEQVFLICQMKVLFFASKNNNESNSSNWKIEVSVVIQFDWDVLKY